MTLTLKTQDSIVESIKAEYSPVEWIVIEDAMRRYAKDREVNIVDRMIMQQMLLSFLPIEVYRLKKEDKE